MLMRDYHVNIFYSDEDKGYIADIPDLRHCSAFGQTPESALLEVLEAKAAWLESAKSHNKPIPNAHYRPLVCDFIDFQIINFTRPEGGDNTA